MEDMFATEGSSFIQTPEQVATAVWEQALLRRQQEVMVGSFFKLGDALLRYTGMNLFAMAPSVE